MASRRLTTRPTSPYAIPQRVVVFVVLWGIGSGTQLMMHRTDVLSDLMEKVSKEEIVPKVTKSFILEKIREAHRTLDTNNVGTIIIKH